MNLDQQVLAHRDILRRMKTENDGSLNEAIHAALGFTTGGLPYSTSFNAAMSLIPYGTWFHYSHLEFTLVPNQPVPGMPVSNAVDYIPYDFGEKDSLRPVQYSTMLSDSPESRRELPLAICDTVFKSRLAQLLKQKAVQDNRLYHVDTGQGPLMATPEGKLAPIPRNKFLKLDGSLIDIDYSDPDFRGVVEIAD